MAYFMTWFCTCKHIKIKEELSLICNAERVREGGPRPDYLITFLTDQHLTMVCSADPHSSAWLPRAFAPLLVHPKLEKDRIKRHTDNHVWAFYATFSPFHTYFISKLKEKCQGQGNYKEKLIRKNELVNSKDLFGYYPSTFSEGQGKPEEFFSDPFFPQCNFGGSHYHQYCHSVVISAVPGGLIKDPQISLPFSKILQPHKESTGITFSKEISVYY